MRSARAAPGCRPCVASASPSVSPTRRRGLRLAYGSWKMICRWRRYGRIARADSGARSTPSKTTSPAVGSSSFSTLRPIVLLPEPDSPTRPSASPLRISKLTSSTARTGRSLGPKYFLRPRTASMAGVDARGDRAHVTAHRRQRERCPSATSASGGIAGVAFGAAERTARRERAARRRIERARDLAGDRVQAPRRRCAFVVERAPRQAGEQAARVRMARRAEQLGARRLPRRRARST